MKKAGNIVLLISGILSIISAVSCLAGGIIMLAFTSPAAYNLIVEGLKSGTISSTLPGTPEQIALTIQAMFLGYGIACVVESLFMAACAVFAFMARAKESLSLFITNIVLGALSGSLTAIAGGIFGIIGHNKEKEAE